MANVESDDPVIPPIAHFSSIKPSPRTDTLSPCHIVHLMHIHPKANNELPHYATLITTYQYSMNISWNIMNMYMNIISYNINVE